jgi:hypothetical protein
LSGGEWDGVEDGGLWFCCVVVVVVLLSSSSSSMDDGWMYLCIYLDRIISYYGGDWRGEPSRVEARNLSGAGSSAS